MTFLGRYLNKDRLVLQRGRDFRWNFQNLDATTREPTNFPAGDLYLELHTYGQENALQQVTIAGASGGTYTLSHESHASTGIDYYDATSNPHSMAGDIQDALEGISSIGAGNVLVHPADLIPVWKIYLSLNAGSNEVQRIIFAAGVSDGTFKLSHDGNFTGALDFGISAADMQTALRGLTSIGSGNCTVTKVSDHEYLVEFIGAKAATDVPQIMGWGVGLGFLLIGALPPGMIQTSTLVNGSAKISEPLMNLVNATINDFFDNFEDLLGVDLDMAITDALNMTLTVTSQTVFRESDLITFTVDATSTAIEAFFNTVSTFLGKIDTIDVDFYWKHIYQVEFVGDLANTTQAALVADISDLDATSVNTTASVTVEVIQAGQPEFAKWSFDIDGDTASIEVESEVADLIVDRTPWQLVFLPDGEEAGGDPIALGVVKVQP